MKYNQIFKILTLLNDVYNNQYYIRFDNYMIELCDRRIRQVILRNELKYIDVFIKSLTLLYNDILNVGTIRFKQHGPTRQQIWSLKRLEKLYTEISYFIIN